MNTTMWKRPIPFLLLLFFGTISLYPSVTFSDEQITAYKIQPTVVLIYSGMYIEIDKKSGKEIIPHYTSGSGFFINPDGYIVAGGHLVENYVKYMEDQNGYAKTVLNNHIVTSLNKQFRVKRGRVPSQKELNTAYMRFIRTERPNVLKHGAINFVLLSNATAQRTPYPFEVKKFSGSIRDGGKDISVLKIQRDNCPIAMLGDSSQLTLQQPLFTFGYPAVDNQRLPNPQIDKMLTASIARGSVSILKKELNGIPTIQHDSAAVPGNTGGPTVDGKGFVMGVYTFREPQTDDFKFSIPINTVKEFIRETGIPINSPSQFTLVLNQLMDSIKESRWLDAQRQVNETLFYIKGEPNLTALQEMIQRRINEMGTLEKMWLRSKLLIILVVALVLVIILVVILMLRPAPPAIPEPVEHDTIATKDTSGDSLKPGDQTRLELVDGTIIEDAIYGNVTMIIKGDKKGHSVFPPAGWSSVGTQRRWTFMRPAISFQKNT